MFDGRAENCERFLTRTERAISELVTNVASNVNLAKTPFSQADAKFLLNWPLVKFRPVNGLLRANLQSKGNLTPKWTPPEKGWIKINFDRASRGNPGPLGAGVIA